MEQKLKAGTKVQAGFWKGRIVDVVDGCDSIWDSSRVNFSNPLYIIKLNLSKKTKPAGPVQIHLEPGQTEVRLFSDEFRIL
jgi:hypothetical protein